MNITLDKDTKLTVSIRERNIGPANDPYGETLIRMSLPDGTYATLLTNGLGMHSAEFYSDFDDHPVRTFKWNWAGGGNEVEKAKHEEQLKTVEDLAQLVFGKTFSDAEEAWQQAYSEMEPDPMGPLSRYI